MNKITFFFLLVFTNCNIMAAQSPMSFFHDSRIKKVVYKKDDIVELKTHFGIGTEIVLPSYETIDFDTVFLGLKGIYNFEEKEHGFIISPLTKQPKEIKDINLSFDTNLRSYTFSLHPPHYQKRRKSDDVTYKIIFEYPDDALALIKRRQKAEKQRKKREIEEAIKKASKPDLKDCESVNLTDVNRDYIAEGSMNTRPIEIFNDKHFTYIKMDQEASITTIDNQGVERLVNSHPGCGFKIIESVYEKIILTRDKEVTCITNNAFHKNKPKSTIKMGG